MHWKKYLKYYMVYVIPQLSTMKVVGILTSEWRDYLKYKISRLDANDKFEWLI